MAVPFLSVYKSLDQFVLKYPAFKPLKQASNLDIVYWYDSLEAKLDCMGMKAKDPLVQQALVGLQELHGLADLSQGLLTLVGVGKGGNTQLMHRGCFVAKFDPGDRYQADLMKDGAALAKMDRCVDLAKAMADHAAQACLQTSDALLAKVALHHLGLAPTDPAWAKVQLNLKKINDGLTGIFRIAANRHVPGRHAVGYVRFKKIADDVVPSVNKTAGAPAGAAKEGATHGGSIHMDYLVFSPRSPWTDLGVATVIVHEASHKFALTEDHAYHHEDDKYELLKPDLRMDNADCYAFVAASLLAGKLLTTRPTSELIA